MIRPITLLCLSDLHLFKGQAGDKAFGSLISSLGSILRNNPEFYPDYIVIAGDVIDAHTEDPKKSYRYAAKRIRDIFRTYQLRSDRVVVAAGNHDKVVLREDSFKTENDNAKAFREAVLKNESLDLSAMYSTQFKAFSEFYSSFVPRRARKAMSTFTPKNNEEFEGTVHYLYNDLAAKCSMDIALAEGVKVFCTDAVVFLCVNTEWTYLPDQKIKSYGKEKRLADDGIVRLYSNGINAMIKTILHHYPHYTIVTVMHRDPSEMSWEEKNAKSYKDILNKIYKYSDVLLTGHEHTPNLKRPDRMANGALHFKLGSSARNGNIEEIADLNARLLRIDPVKREVDVINIEYEDTSSSDGFEWRPYRDGVFMMKAQYVYKNRNGREKSSEYLPVVAVNYEKKSVEKALRSNLVLQREENKEGGDCLVWCFSTDLNVKAFSLKIRKKVSALGFAIAVVCIPVSLESQQKVWCPDVYERLRKNLLPELISLKVALVVVRLIVPQNAVDYQNDLDTEESSIYEVAK